MIAKIKYDISEYSLIKVKYPNSFCLWTFQFVLTKRHSRMYLTNLREISITDVFIFAIAYRKYLISLWIYCLQREVMGSQESKPQENSTSADPKTEDKPAGEKPKCKACCACPETKKVRDAWWVILFINEILKFN